MTTDEANESNKSISKPLEFNDTLEEIDFILSKGTELMKIEKVTFSIHNESKKDKDKENTNHRLMLPTPTEDNAKKWHPAFKKPTPVSSLKKHTFNHIRSPISEYIRNTARNPTIQRAKPVNTQSKQSKKLEFTGNESNRRNHSTTGTQVLPKKAYLSSDIKKVGILTFLY